MSSIEEGTIKDNSLVSLPFLRIGHGNMVRDPEFSLCIRAWSACGTSRQCLIVAYSSTGLRERFLYEDENLEIWLVTEILKDDLSCPGNQKEKKRGLCLDLHGSSM